MPRQILDQAHVHAAVRPVIAAHQLAAVQQVQAALAAHPVVVVGMAINPFPAQARKALDAVGVAHHDIDFGSYFSAWDVRTALKMWTGWPTFPMVFVRGTLVGGASDLKKLIASGALQPLLSAGAPEA